MGTKTPLPVAGLLLVSLSGSAASQLATEGGKTYNIVLPEGSVGRLGYGFGNATITVNPVQR